MFVDNAELVEPQQPIATYFVENFGLKLRCCEVIHCPQAFGVAIEDCVNHWKVCYSGDTKPCEDLVKIGLGSTLSIHEATLEDGMEEEADSKAHCTMSQALDICERMGAYRTVLTHFSQRYPRVPVLPHDLNKIRNTAVAFDFFTINFKDLDILPTTLPLLFALYPNEAPVEAND